MSLFDREKISIKDIDVRLSGWRLSESNDRLIEYDHDNGDVFSINFFDKTPDIKASLADVNGIRNFYRQALIANNMALLECDVQTIVDVPAVYMLAKIPMEPHGFVFLASYTIPRQNNSFVLKYQAIESGTTGIREAAVVAMLPAADIDKRTKQVVPWCADPYDASLDYPVMRNRADAPQYDAQFPEHPLSRTRRFMAQLPERVSISERLRRTPAFSPESAK